MRRPVALLFAVFALCMIMGCGADDGKYIDFSKPAPAQGLAGSTGRSGPRPLRLAVASVSSPNETIDSLRRIADFLSRKIGRQVVMIQRKTYAEVNLLLANDNVDLAFVSTGAYSAYRGLNPIELLVMTEFQGSATYDAHLIVHKDSAFASLDDLEGKVFAFTDPLSFSGHMAVMEALRRKGTVPERFFSRYFYTYSHDRAIWAVANKIADGASIDNQILEVAKRKQPEVMNKIRVIANLGTNPSGPVVIGAGVDATLRETLRDIFLHMHEDPELGAALQRLAIGRFTPPAPHEYDALRELYDRVNGFL
jgi:phosphonate transport system substrate-binding protein